jgi:hypothetical protein
MKVEDVAYLAPERVEELIGRGLVPPPTGSRLDDDDAAEEPSEELHGDLLPQEDMP